MQIRLATMDDVEGIKTLLQTYHVTSIAEEDKKDGFVTTNMTDDQLGRLIEDEEGVTVAAEDGKIYAFAFAASWDFWKEWPFFAYMIEHLHEYEFMGTVLTTENSYQYGPVCLDKSIRGRGIFEEVFYYSLGTMKKRFPIMATFINQINGRSYAAHTKKVRTTEAGTFDYNNNSYYLMACSTSLMP